MSGHNDQKNQAFKQEIKMQLYNIIGKVLGVEAGTLSEDSNAQNTPKWDSLRHIEVVFAIENAFHVRFTMPEIASLRKLGDIRQLLVSKNVKLNDHEQYLERKVA
jgi:acyl carrier protein